MILRAKHKLVICYALGLLLLYPVAYYYLAEGFSNQGNQWVSGPFWVSVRLFISGPGLLIIGLVIIFMMNISWIHRIVGALFALIGVGWSIIIIRELIMLAHA